MNEPQPASRARSTRRGAADTTPDRRSAATRAQLLDATRRCVREHGITGATSRRITTEAGANLGAITYHFGSKDELVAEALFEDLERRVAPALALFDDDPGRPPAETMLDAVGLLTVEFERARDDRLLYLETLLLALRDPRAHRQALRLSTSLRTRLAALIAHLRSEGTVAAWIEPDAAAALVLAVANGIALQTALDPDGPDHVAMAGQFAGLLLAAVPPAD